MKTRYLIGMIVFAFALAAAGRGLAADERSRSGADTPTMGQSGSSSQGQPSQMGSSQTESSAKQMASLDKLKGMKVQDRAGDDVGKISDVVFDTNAGRIAYVILGSGGVMGMGEKKVAVPWQALRIRPDQDLLTLNIDREKLKNAPEAKADMAYDRDFARQVDQYYGVSPSFGGSSESGTGSPRGSGMQSGYPGGTAGSGSTTGGETSGSGTGSPRGSGMQPGYPGGTTESGPSTGGSGSTR